VSSLRGKKYSKFLKWWQVISCLENMSTLSCDLRITLASWKCTYPLIDLPASITTASAAAGGVPAIMRPQPINTPASSTPRAPPTTSKPARPTSERCP
jgi:hypothetical protein